MDPHGSFCFDRGTGGASCLQLLHVEPERPKRLAARLPRLHNLIYNKYYVDEFYFERIINPIVNGSRALWAFVDVNFIDRATYLVGDFVRGMSATARTLQTGNMQQYALYISIAIALMFVYLLEAPKRLAELFGG